MRWHINTQSRAPLPPSPPHSHLQHLLANLNLLIYSWVFEELHTEVALPQGRVALHTVARTAHKQHLHAVLTSVVVREDNIRKSDQGELVVSGGDLPLTGPESRLCVEVLVYMAAEIQFSLQFVFSSLWSVSYHQAQWVIIGHVNISSKCSKMGGIIIGMSIRLPPTLMQEEISLTPHQCSVCLHWKNICFIAVSTDPSNFATWHIGNSQWSLWF